MTPAQAGVALAEDVHPDAPEKPHLCVPQALTYPSRKSSPRLLKTLTQGSRMSSPIRPADPHRCAPERLTGASRRRSPATPGKAHRVPPYRLTRRSRIGSPQASRRSSPTAPEKSHLLGNFEFSRGNTAVNACGRLAENSDAERISRQAASFWRCRMSVDISVANRRRLVRSRFAKARGSNALYS